MSKENEIINDPALYRKLCEPFPNVEAANNAIQGFNREVRELRAKYKLPDVSLVIYGSYLNESGTEGNFIIDSHHGDELKIESMLAWAFGRAQSDRQQMIYEKLSSTIDRPKKAK